MVSLSLIKNLFDLWPFKVVAPNESPHTYYYRLYVQYTWSLYLSPTSKIVEGSADKQTHRHTDRHTDGTDYMIVAIWCLSKVAKVERGYNVCCVHSLVNTTVLGKFNLITCGQDVVLIEHTCELIQLHLVAKVEARYNVFCVHSSINTTLLSTCTLIW